MAKNSADLCRYLEGSVGVTATDAETTVKLNFRVCERVLADGGAGETIGLGSLLPGRRNEPCVW